MLISPFNSQSALSQTDNVFLVLPLRKGLLVEVPGMGSGKQFSRESSPEEGSNKSRGPEMGVTPIYSGSESRPHGWDKVNGGEVTSDERCDPRGRRGQVTKSLEGCGEGFRF